MMHFIATSNQQTKDLNLNGTVNSFHLSFPDILNALCNELEVIVGSKYYCRPCGKPYSKKSNFRYHVFNLHMPPKFECPICCNGVKMNKQSVYNHVKKWHPELEGPINFEDFTPK